MEEEVFR